MDSLVRRLNKEVKAYDKELYVERTPDGRIDLWRKGYRWEHFEFESANILYARPQPHLIFSLTENWTVHGRPVEWGVEPVMSRLKELDAWRDDSSFDRMVREREKLKENEERALRNEIRAAAYDMRRDFAKATNDINTSALEKVDSRRNRDGYRK